MRLKVLPPAAPVKTPARGDAGRRIPAADAVDSHFHIQYGVTMRMRKPKRQRANPKARRIRTPPPGVDLAQVAERCRYVGSPYHKNAPGFAGEQLGHRPDASICPHHLATRPDVVESWLRNAVTAGRTGTWENGFPRYVWHREDETVFEARQGSPGSGTYHGYPLEPNQIVRGLE